MKTNRFIKEIKPMGFDVKDLENVIVIIDSNEDFIAKVSKKEVGVLATDFPHFYKLEHDRKLRLLDFLIEYAKTPIKDREEEEKYYLRQKGIGSWSFLNYNIKSTEYSLSGNKDDYTYKTQFTQSEIDEMPECYTHPAVWEKIKTERED